MVTRIVKTISWLGLGAIIVWMGLSFIHPAEVYAQPILAPNQIDIPPCELPGPVTIEPPEPGTFVVYPGNDPNFVISCLRFHRSHYQVGDTWQISMVVQNVGAASSVGTLEVEFQLCRWDEYGDDFVCRSPSNSTAVIPDMESGTNQLVQHSGDFIELYEDPDPGYVSWRDGVPNNLQVYLNVNVRQSGVIMTTAITEAIYPSGPDSQVAGDQDGDGWPAPPDCDDTNPDMHPDANEILGNGIDENCGGGDVSPASFGCDDPVEVLYTAGNPPYPPCDGPPGSHIYLSLDLDQDTWVALEPGAVLPTMQEEEMQVGDCDDLNAAVYPGAPELLVDGLDNNCNGLIDEGYWIPDWVIGSFTLERDSEPYDFADVPDLVMPGLRYEAVLENQGEYLGDDFSVVPVLIYAPGHGIISTAASGFLYYNLLPNGSEYACSANGLVAAVPDIGFYHETNTANNQTIANVPYITSPDRALGFSSDPSLQYNSGDTSIVITPNGEILGTCPPLPTLNGYEYVQTQYQMTINGETVLDQSGGALNYIPPFTIPPRPALPLTQPLSNHDIVCLEITLDPNYLVLEDHSDDMFVGIFEYRNPLFGQSYFEELLVEYIPAGVTWTLEENLCGEIGASQGALTTGGGFNAGVWIGMVLVGLVGGGIGLLGGRQLALGRLGLVLLTAGGAVVGGIGGWGVGEALERSQASRQVGIVIDDLIEEPSTMPSCDLYLDSGSATPGENASFENNSRTMPLSINLIEGFQPAPTVLEISLISPSGREAILPVSLAEDGATFQLDLADALRRQGSDLLLEEGEFVWSVALGQLELGGDLVPYQSLCQGSSEHIFTILPAPTAAPTDTPTATTEPPTQMATTAAPDAQGPSVSGVGDSPDPVFTNGNPPDTTTVSAVVTDPSGVASVTLYYSDGGKTAYQVWGSMSGSGGSYSTVFGPFGSAGAYEYRIYAVDSLGNANCSTGSIDSCPGGVLTVIIP